MEYIPLGSLALWQHLPEGTPKANLLLIHGIGEHSGRHRHTIAALLKAGIAVVRFDLRGAGQSGGRRQWVESFNDYVEDANQAFNWMHRNLENRPQFILGHSMGGAIATHFAALRGDELNGLLLSSPAYLVGEAISALKITVGRVVAPWVPKLRIPRSDDHDCISRDKKEVELYARDPLTCHFSTFQQGLEVLNAQQILPEKARHIRCPVIISHGTADRLIRFEGSEEILQNMASEDKELYKVPGGYHELHNDLDREAYFAKITAWILAHLKK